MRPFLFSNSAGLKTRGYNKKMKSDYDLLFGAAVTETQVYSVSAGNLEMLCTVEGQNTDKGIVLDVGPKVITRK